MPQSAPDQEVWHDYDVVIPTTGRESLIAALDSVLQQILPPRSILVVWDSAEPITPQLIERWADGRLTLLTPVERRPGNARRVGTIAAEAPWVAYLDDDDLWLPDKMQRQLQAAGKATVVASRYHLLRVDGALMARHAPATLLEGAPVDRYLFRSRRLSHRRNSLHTSTLVVRTDVASSVGWAPLVRHQDWDFLLRLRRDVPDAAIEQVADPLALVRYGSQGSISRSVDWSASLEWATASRAAFSDDATHADFLAGQVVRYALASGAYRPGLRLLWGSVRRGCSSRALLLGASGLLSGAMSRRRSSP